MTNFYDSEILDILPDNMKDKPECIALSYALKKANQRFIDYANKTSVYAVIDTLPEKLLDILAIELRTQYYDDTFPVERKRALVKNTMLWYHKAGTVAAVQEMIDNVFSSGIVLEWYETGGEPGTFTISTTNMITPDLIEEFKSVVSNVKNVRSHLENIVIGNRADISLYVAMGISSHEVTTLR
ncbi:MAG: phage tail protein I [Lachnospiraceae bacterium]|nr:phage tail protein I [Lachnospiraceae bacterium]